MTTAVVEWLRLQMVLPFILLTLASFNASTKDSKVFFKNYQDRLHDVKLELQDRLHEEQPRRCSCAHNACGPLYGQYTYCINTGKAQDLNCSFGSCPYRRVHCTAQTEQSVMRRVLSNQGTKSSAFFQTPPFTSLSSGTSDVKRDICLPQGIERFFSEFSDDDDGIARRTFFSAAKTGITTSWPGYPQRMAEDNGSCASFEPRVEPWWKLASQHQRNVVILIDVSESMKENVFQSRRGLWDLLLHLTNCLLDSFGEDDAFQIVAFNPWLENLATDSTTGSNHTMVQATKENVENMKSMLEKTEPLPQPEADIGGALERAFNLFKTNPVTNGMRCENVSIINSLQHIILITGSKDCASTKLHDCTSKRHAGLQTHEFLHNATSVMLDFVQEELIGSVGEISPPVLFTYSLHPRANGLLSQLACQLNGIHVDVEKALKYRIVDPIHLMSGYFATTALSMAESFGGDRLMAISHRTEDNDGSDLVSTFVMPVLYRPRDDCPYTHYGVIGTEITRGVYEQAGVNYWSSNFENDVVNWNSGLRECRPTKRSHCEMQVLRQAECVSPAIPRDEDIAARCFQYKGSYYYINYTAESSPGFPGLNLAGTRAKCKELGGKLVTPQNKDERRVLAAIVPPDGVWIDAEMRGREWFWTDGKRIEDASGIRRTCPTAFGVGFYMDPRSYDNNIQCTHTRVMLTPLCQFSRRTVPDICSDLEIVELDAEVPLNGTLEDCGMVECMLTSEAYADIEISDLICTGDTHQKFDYNEEACCSPEELIGKCEMSKEAVPTMDQDEGSSMSIANDVTITWIVLIVSIVSSFLALSCAATACLYGRHASLAPNYTVLDRNGPVGFQTNNVKLVVQQSGQNDLGRSPFEFASVDSPRADGKRPELAVNIEVKVLDNGWERSGGHGRVRQGEYMDCRGQVHKVAVKFVDALAPTAAWKALRNEFEILSTIPLHPNIVRPIGAHWGDRSGHTERYIVEELMYTNLGDVISGSEPCPFPGKTLLYRDWIRIFIDIASGLQHLHQNKIIHFDLKPRNVLLTEDMTAKLADFGCSKQKFETHFKLSAMAGTPPYLAPECWMSYYAPNTRAEVARSKIDIYSLGVIMWECLNDGGIAPQPDMYLPNRLALHLTGPSSYACSSISRSETTHHPLSSAAFDLYSRLAETNACMSAEEVEVAQPYQLPDEIPVLLRQLVSACVEFDFEFRPSCEQILDALNGMSEAEWADQPRT